MDLDNPGPCDSSVLTEQDLHVSSAIWEGEDRGVLKCHEHTKELKMWKLTEAQIKLVEMAGFKHLSMITDMSIDAPLISALVERWRRETNSFHMRVGEMTITLEDVFLILGLPIDGDPVIGVTSHACESICRKLLGNVPRPEHRSGRMVKLSWLRESFSRCPEDASEEQIKRSTRAYLLYLLGCTIFSSSTGNKVPVMYLQFFENFDDTKRYAWGAAALAYLYRALGNASLNGQTSICGSITLLQCWSYEHLKVGRPALENFHKSAQDFPRALKWRRKRKVYSNSKSLSVYREALDTLELSDVTFLPYIDMDNALIQEEMRKQMTIGRSSTMLICFDKAERHLPDRCLRQFGMHRSPPTPVKQWKRKSRDTYESTDLSKKMASELREWKGRRNHIIKDDLDGDESRYMDWYLNITRKLIGRPSPQPNPATQQAPPPLCNPTSQKLSPPSTTTTQQRSSPLSSSTMQILPSPIPTLTTQHRPSPVACSTTQQMSSPQPTPTSEQMLSPLPTAATQTLSSIPTPIIQQSLSPLAAPTTQQMPSPLPTHTTQQTASAPLTSITHPAPPSSSTTQQMASPLPTLATQQGSSPLPSTATERSFNPNELESTKISSLLSSENARMSAALREIAHITNDLSTEGFDSQQLQSLLKIKELLHVGYGDETEVGVEVDPRNKEVVNDDGDPDQTLLSQLHYLATACAESSQNPEPTLDEDPSHMLVSTENLSQPPVQIPLTWPVNGILTLDWIHDVMSAFEWSSWNISPSEFTSILPSSVFDSLLNSASRILHKEPNCVRIDCFEEDLSVVIVGDICGKLHDLIFLLQDAGFPSQNRIFVFNGDYIGIGGWGLETFLLLLAWKVLLPHRVYLLRGNHETKLCTSECGFEEEVMTKYGDQGKHVYRRCLDCFSKLPLASTIAGRVYTTHGGLFRSSSISIAPLRKSHKMKDSEESNHDVEMLSLGSLEELSKAKRTILDPRSSGTNSILCDALWSDPSMECGLKPNLQRGCGLLWGPDCTETFLKKSNLKLIIRSHEGPDAREKREDLGRMDEGYSIDHEVESGKLITLFSAPDFPPSQSSGERLNNKGAYIVLGPPTFDDPVFHTFKAVTLGAKIGKMEDSQANERKKHRKSEVCRKREQETEKSVKRRRYRS